jgi:hypothetical protein
MKWASCRSGDWLLARLDLKGDGQGGRLLVHAGQSGSLPPIAKELAAMADWLDGHPKSASPRPCRRQAVVADRVDRRLSWAES